MAEQQRYLGIPCKNVSSRKEPLPAASRPTLGFGGSESFSGVRPRWAAPSLRKPHPAFLVIPWSFGCRAEYLNDCKERLRLPDRLLEVAVGLEPTKTGFADQRLDRFGIATKLVQNLHLNLH
jgi:hypothetical protein